MKRICPSIFILLMATTLTAQDFAEISLPETRAARGFKIFLQAIKSGDYESFLQDHCTQSFIKAAPMAEHIDFFRQVTAMHGGFKVHTIKESDEFKLVVIAQSNSGRWRKIHVATEKEPPYKIAGLLFDQAAPPADGAPPAKKMSEKDILTFVADKLKQKEKEDTFSGAVLIARQGESIFREAYGLANKSFAVPNRPDTKFNIGSINKSFTEMAIAQLLERGLISLSDKVGDHLTGFSKEVAKKVTILHLLTMRSGFGSYWNQNYWSRFTTIKSIADLLDLVKNESLAFEPGAKRQYSNSGFVVLGAIIEKVSGMDYYDYVRRHIFEPAGMTNTDSYELDQIVTNLAIGYTRNRSASNAGKSKRQNNLFIHGIKGSPAGGGYSTVDDLLKYVNALQKDQLAGHEATNLVLDLFQNVENPTRRPMDFGIAGGAPVGINAIVEADFGAGYTVIVLSNYDPPVAEDIGLMVMEMLRNLE